MGSKPSKVLERFDNPKPERDYEIEFDCPEFTCLCPLTGQPDFANIIIRYVPDRFCVELKSLKNYLWSFRNEGVECDHRESIACIRHGKWGFNCEKFDLIVRLMILP